MKSSFFFLFLTPSVLRHFLKASDAVTPLEACTRTLSVSMGWPMEMLAMAPNQPAPKSQAAIAEGGERGGGGGGEATEMEVWSLESKGGGSFQFWNLSLKG